MDENTENVQEQVSPAQQLADCAEKLNAAAEALQTVLGKLEAQYESLNQKVDRIVAAIEDGTLHAAAAPEQAMRKTLPSTVTTLLAKSGMESEATIEAGVLDKALQALSVEQRIAVKAEMARAGLLAE